MRVQALYRARTLGMDHEGCGTGEDTVIRVHRERICDSETAKLTLHFQRTPVGPKAFDRSENSSVLRRRSVIGVSRVHPTRTLA